MPISSSHHELFHQSNTADKISLFQSLLQSKDLNADEALALLKSIHTELEQPQGHAPSVYEDYAHMMESLHHAMPEVHQHVVANWQSPQQATLPDEVSDEIIDEAQNKEAEIKHVEKTEKESATEPQGEAGGETEEPEEPEVEEESEGEKEEEVEEKESEEAEEQEQEEREREEEQEREN